MSEVILFPHNEKGYNKLEEALKTNKCATINHATGTGKTAIILKYLNNNKNKKFLYIAPTHQIIDQLETSCYNIGITPQDINVDTMTYRNFLKVNIEEIYAKYDGFILDEYHNIGAIETYKKIKELKELLDKGSFDKKFIGLTATPIRYLDKERNMTDEIFDGVVASHISLSEALAEGLLPIPTYVNSIMSCMGNVINTQRAIDKLSDVEVKKRLQEKLEKIKERIEQNPDNMQEMIKTHMKEKEGKFIVFCSNIEDLDKYYKEADKWFSDIGEIKKYKVHSRQKRIENKEELDNFNDQEEGLSVLFCVDVLNEGVHAKGVNNLIFLRKTQSPRIYFQQTGRGLSFSSRKKDITIYDIQNNFENHSAIYAVYEEFKEEIEKKIKLYPEREAEYRQKLEKFKIMDETKSIMKELEDIKKERDIYSALTCRKEIEKLEIKVKTIKDEIRASLSEKIDEIKEKVNEIEIDINKDISEYKELNKEILVELLEIKKIIAVETSKNKNLSCVSMYKRLERVVKELPRGENQRKLLEELNKIDKEIKAWKENFNWKEPRTEEKNSELLEKLKNIEEKYNYMFEAYKKLTCIKLSNKIRRKIIKKVGYGKIYEQINAKLEEVEEKIGNIEINKDIPLEEYEKINERLMEELNKINRVTEYIEYRDKCSSECLSYGRKISSLRNNKEKAKLAKKLEYFKQKILLMDNSKELNLEKYIEENGDILQEIKTARAELSGDKIIKSEIDYAIEILSEIEEQSDIFLKDEAKAAYKTISKHAKRVDNEQFKKLMELEILLPEELDVSEEERQQELGQYSSIHEKENNEIADNLREIIEFIKENGRNVDLKTKDPEEQQKVNKYLKMIVGLSKKQEEEIRAVFKTYNIKSLSWEKVLIGEEITETDVEEIIRQARNYIDTEIVLPKYLYEAVNGILIKNETSRYKELWEILEQADEIDENQKGAEERYKKVSETVEYLANNIEIPEKELLSKEFMGKMKGMSQREISYIKKRYSILKTKQFESYLKNTENTNMTHFCRKVKNLDLNTIQEYRKNVNEDLELYATLNGLIKFVKSNNGKYPDPESKEETENKIANKLKELIATGKLVIGYEGLEDLLNVQWCNMEDIINNVTSSRYKEADIKRVILATMEFVKKEGRKPLLNSGDDSEKKLSQEYDKICIGLLKETDLAILNRFLNSKQFLRKTIEEYYKNKEEGRE